MAVDSLNKDKVVLAYSGGLDTACILKDLIERGYEVIAYVADVGQQEDFDDVAERAMATGAAKVVVEDLKRDFVTEFIYPAIAGNAIYENRYLLGTSLARPVIARRQVEVALAEGASALAHGATGKGNDQVRFELAYAALAPNLEVISPWKERAFLNRFQGRSDLLAYAKAHDIPVEATVEKPYSSDENLMHRSYEAGLLEDPEASPPADMFKLTRALEDTPDEATDLTLHFQDAIPVRVECPGEGVDLSEPVALFTYLNEKAGEHGIGRVDMVENRFVGIKSRGVYETPGGTVLHHALRDLEGIAMDREVLRLRDMLSPRFAEIITTACGSRRRWTSSRRRSASRRSSSRALSRCACSRAIRSFWGVLRRARSTIRRSPPWTWQAGTIRRMPVASFASTRSGFAPTS